jgi:glycosyltransferase involved in cell wall biosynthesis
MTEPIVALLGRRDEPTDAIEQYCAHLGAALRTHDFKMDIVRVRWKELGWPAALRHLQQESENWRSCWVLLQYTALSWSSRGFPLQLSGVLKILRNAGARVGVVYHDVEPYPGRRAIDYLRRFMQRRVLRQALRSSDRAILTVPARQLSWITAETKKAVFIPVGANFLHRASMERDVNICQDETPTVAVFGVTGGIAGQQEVLKITGAVRSAAEKLGKLRLLVFGRDASSVEESIRQKLCDLPVTVRVEGVLPENDLERLLSSADVLLFVRGPISSRRGSAIAGIACGLPIIAFAGGETAAPITEAGVVLVPGGNEGAWGKVLVRVLGDQEFRARLAERSRAAYKNHFSWEAIAARYASVLRAPLEVNNS